MISFDIPIHTKNSTNMREHWRVRAKRTSRDRSATAIAGAGVKRLVKPTLLVRLIRIGRQLDDDNLRPALKGVRDQVAAMLRVDDASPLVRWEYEQAPGKPNVRVEVSDHFCRACGCTEERACVGGCAWAMPFLCTRCGA